MRKVFCIGANKTGTTSLLEFFRYHGYHCADQAEGELVFAQAYAKKNWQAIVDFAAEAEFFQDLPFSAAHTYKALDEAYPGSLFILTRRTTAEQWYGSLLAFHARKWGDGVHPPTADQLRAATYRYPGFAWEANRALYASPADDPYRRSDLIAWYEEHLRDVRTYFAGNGPTDPDKAKQLLDIDIADPEAAKKIADFAGFTPQLPILPHLNRNLP